MKKLVIVYLLLVLGLAQSQEVIKRTGIAVGYVSAPSSFLFRTSLSEKSAFEIWAELPRLYLGDNQGFLIGIGCGYAMFPVQRDNVALYLRPGVGVRYSSHSNYSEGALYIGVAFGVEAYLDSLGLDYWDVLFSTFLGSSAVFGKGFSQVRIPLFNEEPFGICIGVIKYF